MGRFGKTPVIVTDGAAATAVTRTCALLGVGIAGLTGTDGIKPPDGRVAIGETTGTPGMVGMVG